VYTISCIRYRYCVYDIVYTRIYVYMCIHVDTYTPCIYVYYIPGIYAYTVYIRYRVCNIVYTISCIHNRYCVYDIAYTISCIHVYTYIRVYMYIRIHRVYTYIIYRVYTHTPCIYEIVYAISCIRYRVCIYTHTRIHVYIQVKSRQPPVCVSICTHIHTGEYMCIYILHTHVYKCIYIHTYTYTYIYTHSLIYILHIYTPIYTYTHIHVHMYARVRTCSSTNYTCTRTWSPLTISVPDASHLLVPLRSLNNPAIGI